LKSVSTTMQLIACHCSSAESRILASRKPNKRTWM
jgi:hypothetical protein